MAEGITVRKYDLLLIGGSAGSLDALLQILPSLPVFSGLAVVVVLHRRSGESLLPELLSEKTAWIVKEADEKENIEPGTIYVAPADYHLLIERNRTFSLDYSEKVNYSRPSIDVTFESAADVYGATLMALLLSGANQDGTEGLRKVKEAGGFVMVQDPAEAAVSYMPQHALDGMQVNEVVAVVNVAGTIRRLLLP